MKILVNRAYLVVYYLGAQDLSLFKASRFMTYQKLNYCFFRNFVYNAFRNKCDNRLKRREMACSTLNKKKSALCS